MAITRSCFGRLIVGRVVTVGLLAIEAVPAEADSSPGVVEISSSGTIEGGLARAGVPDRSVPHLAAPLVGMVATPDEGGAWEVAADEGVFAFGSAAG